MDDKGLETLLARTAGGEGEALHGLYLELSGAVFALTRAILRDRGLAEDALQDTFVKIYRKARTYRPGGNPRAWVLAVARNTAYSALRRRRETPAEAVADRPDDGPDAADAAALRAAMAALPPQQREIVLLSALDGFTQREIASILGIPAGSVSWKYCRALGSLRARLSSGE